MAESTGIQTRSENESVAQQAIGQTQEKVQEVAEQARAAGEQATAQARSALRTQIDQRSSQFSGQVSSAADNLRTVGEELRRQGNDGAARVADQVASRAESLSGYLSSSDADRILRDVESFARRQPWAVVVGGMALGFAASRFLKASSSKRYYSSSSTTPTLGSGTAGYGTSSALPQARTSDDYTPPTYGSATI